MTEKLPEKITIGEKYNPAMECENQEEANAYLEACIEHSLLQGFSREEAEQMERSNIRYYAGYFKDEITDRVRSLF